METAASRTSSPLVWIIILWVRRWPPTPLVPPPPLSSSSSPPVQTSVESQLSRAETEWARERWSERVSERDGRRRDAASRRDVRARERINSARTASGEPWERGACVIVMSKGWSALSLPRRHWTRRPTTTAVHRVVVAAVPRDGRPWHRGDAIDATGMRNIDGKKK